MEADTSLSRIANVPSRVERIQLLELAVRSAGPGPLPNEIVERARVFHRFIEDVYAPDEIEITPEMIDAGESVILCEVGGAEGLGGFFSACALASEVYRAMHTARKSKNSRTSEGEPP